MVRISTLTKLEIGYSARSAGDLQAALDKPPLSSMPVEYVTPAIELRSVEVQLGLARQGHHRAPSVADLVIAATAELKNLTVLHMDKDFDLIAKFTGQRAERLRLANT